MSKFDPRTWINLTIARKKFNFIPWFCFFQIGMPTASGRLGNVIRYVCYCLIIAFELSFSRASAACPRQCFCNAVNRIVYCSRRGLTIIPDSIPSNTVQLNMNGNQFESGVLKRSNLTSYPELEHLYFSECGIETIEAGAFVDLKNLQWLDISNNRIRIIADETFRGLSLQHLFLNGNRNIQLGPRSFDGEFATNGLYLHDCSLSWINPDVLTPLGTSLRFLWLNGNELEKLERRFLPYFLRLRHLRLGSNPLRCNCEAVWLKEFYDKNGEIFKGAVAPSCLAPKSLKGKYFTELSLFDLRCQAPQFKNIDVSMKAGNVRLGCKATGDPAPALFWIRPSGKTTKFSPPMEEDVLASDAVLQLDPIDPDAVPGMYVCVATNEAGNATLTVNIPPFHPPPLHAEPPDALPTPTPEAFTDRIATFANQFRRDKA